MGISIDLWRFRIGTFCQKSSRSHLVSGSCYISITSCIIALLLLMAGIEPNPGPTVAELARKLDDFIGMYNVTRDQIQLSIPVLAKRLDEDIKAIHLQLTTINNSLTLLNNRIVLIESRVSREGATGGTTRAMALPKNWQKIFFSFSHFNTVGPTKIFSWHPHCASSWYLHCASLRVTARALMQNNNNVYS
jgi:hypothetical protein